MTDPRLAPVLDRIDADLPAATERLIGWTPRVSLTEGLRRTIAHYRTAAGLRQI